MRFPKKPKQGVARYELWMWEKNYKYWLLSSRISSLEGAKDELSTLTKLNAPAYIVDSYDGRVIKTNE